MLRKTAQTGRLSRILVQTGIHTFEEIQPRLERVLDAATADETELVWFERQRGCVRTDGPCQHDPPLLSVMVRVVEGRRLGWFRADTAEVGELENAVRHALALAKLEPQLGRRSLFPRRTDDSFVRDAQKLRDPAIEALDPATALGQLRDRCQTGERGALRWGTSQLTIFNSHGVRRHTTVTDISADVSSGAPDGAGFASASSRSLHGLGLQQLFDRARSLATNGNAGSAAPDKAWPPLRGVTPALLSPEAAACLLDVVNGYAFSGRAFLDGTSFLSQHRNVQVFDRRVHLRDDGSSDAGLPFPFDFEGSPKQPLELIVAGTPSTPALNRHQGHLAGMHSTGQSVGGGDSMFGNLFLQSGDAAGDDLLAAADGGIFIGWLERPVCLDPGHLTVRVTARGVREIENGALGRALPDLVWEDSLLRVLARVEAVGGEPVVRAMSTTPLGSISTPALALTGVEGLRPTDAS